MINNRQAGRRRGRGGQQQRSQGSNPGRGQDNGNRIDNRSRGNAAQLLEKYKTLARDAQMQGDRVNTEYYLQFADHYFRVLAETRSRFEENRLPQPGGANSYQDDEQDYDDDGEPIVRAEQQRGHEGQREGNRDQGRDQGREQGRDQGRDQGREQNRDASRDQGRDQGRDQNRDGNRNEGRANGNGQSGGYQSGAQYDDERPRARQNGNSGGGGSRYTRDDRGNDNGGDRDERGPERASYAEADEDRRPARDENAVPAERPRRGRPRRETAAEAPAEFEADRLPPSLSISAVSEDTEEKPRRRRTRAPVSETPPTA